MDRGWVVFGIVASMVGQAHAQAFDVERLQLAVTGGDFIATEGAGARRARPFSYRADVSLRFSDAQLVLVQDGERRVLVGQRTLLDFTAGVQFGKWFGFGIDVPVMADQKGEGAPAGPGFGDLRLVPRVELVRRQSFGLALLSGLRVPTGDTGRFIGEGGVVFEPRLAAQVDWRILRVALNVGARVRQHERRYVDLFIGHELTAALAVAVVPHRRLDLVAELHANTALSSRFGEASTSPIEFLVGAGVHVGPFRFGAAAGAGLVDGYGAPRYRVLASVTFSGEGRERWAKVAYRPQPPVVAAPAPEEEEDDEAEEGEQPPAVVSTAVAPPSISERRPVGSPVFFHLNRARITSAARDALATLAAELNQRSELDAVWVEGHADEVGPDHWNEVLSRRRAERVVRVLVELGVDARRLHMIGWGVARPVDPNPGLNERNRCVDFFGRRVAVAEGVAR